MPCVTIFRWPINFISKFFKIKFVVAECSRCNLTFYYNICLASKVLFYGCQRWRFFFRSFSLVHFVCNIWHAVPFQWNKAIGCVIKKDRIEAHAVYLVGRSLSRTRNSAHTFKFLSYCWQDALTVIHSGTHSISCFFCCSHSINWQNMQSVFGLCGPKFVDRHMIDFNKNSMRCRDDIWSSYNQKFVTNWWAYKFSHFIDADILCTFTMMLWYTYVQRTCMKNCRSMYIADIEWKMHTASVAFRFHIKKQTALHSLMCCWFHINRWGTKNRWKIKTERKNGKNGRAKGNDVVRTYTYGFFFSCVYVRRVSVLFVCVCCLLLCSKVEPVDCILMAPTM